MVLLVILSGVFLWDFLSGTNCFYYSDFSDRWIPWLQFVKRSIFSGQSFLWDPDIMLGFPLFAESEVGALYPPNWLIFLFTEAQYGVSVILFLHLAFCSVFTYKLAQRLSVSEEGSFLSAVAYTFCGSLTAQTTNYIITLAACYAPFMFYQLLCYKETSEFRYLMRFGIALGIQLFICHIQTTFILYTASSVFFVFLTLRRSRFFFRDLLRYAGVSLFAAGLAAVQLLPLYELTGLSVRSGGLGYDSLTGYSLRPSDYFSMIFPWMYGNSRAGSFNGNWYFEETHVYAGIFAFFFAVFFFLYRGRKSLSRAQLALLPVLGAAFILSLGRYIPAVDLYRVLQNVPGFNYFRCPARWSIMVMLCISLFGGAGFDGAMSQLSKKNAKTLLLPALFLPAGIMLLWLTQLSGVYGNNLMGRVLTEALVLKTPLNFMEAYVTLSIQKIPPLYYFALNCVLLFLLMLAVLRGLISLKAGRTAIIVLAVLDIFLIEAPQNPRRPMDYFPQKSLAFAPVKEKAGNDRVMMIAPPSACDPPDMNYLCGNSATYFGLRVPTGTSPLILQSYKDLSENISFSLLELTGVRYLITPYYDTELKRFHYEMEEVRSSFPHSFALSSVRPVDFRLPGNIFLDQNKFIVQNSVAMSDADFKRLSESNPAAYNLMKDNAGIMQPAEISHYENTKVVIRARTEMPALLVLTDTNYPGWKAEVNGKKAGIYPVHGVFRSVFLPEAGTYNVIFSFRPISVYIGAAVSLLCILAAGIYLFVFCRKNSRDKAN